MPWEGQKKKLNQLDRKRKRLERRSKGRHVPTTKQRQGTGKESEPSGVALEVRGLREADLTCKKKRNQGEGEGKSGGGASRVEPAERKRSRHHFCRKEKRVPN